MVHTILQYFTTLSRQFFVYIPGKVLSNIGDLYLNTLITFFPADLFQRYLPLGMVRFLFLIYGGGLSAVISCAALHLVLELVTGNVTVVEIGNNAVPAESAVGKDTHLIQDAASDVRETFAIPRKAGKPDIIYPCGFVIGVLALLVVMELILALSTEYK
jgi:hypothetical protein